MLSEHRVAIYRENFSAEHGTDGNLIHSVEITSVRGAENPLNSVPNHYADDKIPHYFVGEKRTELQFRSEPFHG